MKEVLFLYLVCSIFFQSSCETDHTNQKLFLNLSEYTLKITDLDRHYLENFEKVLLPQDSIIIDYRWSFGCATEEDNLPPCTLLEADSISAFIPGDSTLQFIGNFSDENRWYSDFIPGKSSNQIFTFTFVNDDFE
tara:strand:+ start:143 stop:547 length:405 start_codon:yes stop_codon:yes gene_type:complete